MSPLRDYLAQVQQAIRTFPGIQVEEYWEQLLTVTRANLRIRLHLADNSLLEISEALAVEGGSRRPTCLMGERPACPSNRQGRAGDADNLALLDLRPRTARRGKTDDRGPHMQTLDRRSCSVNCHRSSVIHPSSVVQVISASLESWQKAFGHRLGLSPIASPQRTSDDR
jgi:hypothetical protein